MNPNIRDNIGASDIQQPNFETGNEDELREPTAEKLDIPEYTEITEKKEIIVEKQLTEKIKMTQKIEMTEKIEIIVEDPIFPNTINKKLHYTFIILVNSISGDNKASLLTKLDIEKMVFSTFNPNDADVEVHIYKLNEPENRSKALQTVKKLQDTNAPTIVRIIVGGGDGSIMWAVQEMITANIDFNKCAIGTIPFGTGNDFSRVLGWGPTEPKQVIGTHLGSLKDMISKWVHSQVIDFDIWEITIDTYPHGGLRTIHKAHGQKKWTKRFMSHKHPETEAEMKLSTHKKLMCNYFSFGIDSRIGYGFDKGRTKSRLGNKIVYGWEGIKKLFLKTPRVNDVVENIQILKVNENGEEVPLREFNKGEGGSEFSSEDFLMYPGALLERAKTDGQIHMNVSVIKGNPSVFLCLNIPSYMGGASDPWKSAKGKIGTHTHDKKKIADFGEQKFGDSKIEVLSFGGPISMAAERMFPGQGRRLAQVKGPFIINFKQSQNEAKPLHTYMQIDGEFYQVIAPKSVKVALCPRLPNGKVRVLQNVVKKK